MIKPYFIFLIALLLLLSNCKSNLKSYVLVGESHETTCKMIGDQDLYFTDEFMEKYISKDTIFIGFYRNALPMEALFLFEGERCYYQEMKIYCSPCADQTLDDILKDKRFKFEKLDEVNYQSRKKKEIIMRVVKVDLDETCSELKIIDTSVAREIKRRH